MMASKLSARVLSERQPFHANHTGSIREFIKQIRSRCTFYDPANMSSNQTTVYCILAHTNIRNNPSPGHASKSNTESCRGNVLNKDCETFPLHVQMMKQERLMFHFS